jgi:hypothetical protein
MARGPWGQETRFAAITTLQGWEAVLPNSWLKLLDQTRTVTRLKNYSLPAERCCR